MRKLVELVVEDIGQLAELRDARVFRYGTHHTVLLSQDKIESGDVRWHVSVSHPFRLPTWPTLREIQDAIQPYLGEPVWFCIPYPPRDSWMNCHPNTLHFWEIKDEPLKRQWKRDGQAARALGKGEPT